jgi:hypothetical protein
MGTGDALPEASRLLMLKDRLRHLLEVRPEVLDAYLFGSTARGSHSPRADVDIAVFVDVDRAGAPVFGYRAELTAALMAGLARNDIDVVVLNNAPPLLYHRVLRDGVRLVARRPRETTAREGRALSRYCDYLPQLAKIGTARRRGQGHQGAQP